MRGGRISGEENRERGDEEERKHSGDKDPVGEEAPEAESTETRSSSAPASSESDRHWNQDLSLSFNQNDINTIRLNAHDRGTEGEDALFQIRDCQIGNK